MPNRFSKVLLLSNLSVDMGMPRFREGAYTGTLLPMARLLEAQKGISTRIMANPEIGKHVAEYAAARGTECPPIATIDMAALEADDAHDFMIRSYCGSLSEEQLSRAKKGLLAALDGWEPDVVISWEAPSGVFRSLFPEATVLDIMPGMFMRPPYPRMISFDPVGLYGDCWFADEDLTTQTAPPSVMADFNRLRKFYKNHFDLLKVDQALSDPLQGGQLSGAALIPLQISDYFGWKDNTSYRSQYALIEDVQRHFPADAPTIYTQYVGAVINENVINANNLHYLRDRYENFVYDEAFEKLDNITQYMTPRAGTMVSVSSTLGLQAKFYGNKLVSPSLSHLSYLADSTDLKTAEEAPNRNLDKFMANYLGRTNILAERVTKEPEYLLAILNAFVDRRGQEGIEKFPNFETVGNSAAILIERSNTKRSQEIFQKAFPSPLTPCDRLSESRVDALRSNKIETVSFDVFDTLVCRTVLSPAHVFDLIQSRLRKTHLDQLGENFVSSFAEMRIGTERLIRFELDHADEPGSEELLISDVYKAMLDEHYLPVDLVDELIAIEQDVELTCLIPRKEGVRLFDDAIAAGKQVIIISDFIHPTDFVERVLRQCGVDGWHHIFVSSDVGLKKHSGSLFEFVEQKLDLEKSSIVHFGDNSHGDINMGKRNGWEVQHVPAVPFNLRKLFRERKLNLPAVNSSLIVGAVLSGLGNEFYQFGASRNPDTDAMQLVATPRELGFMTVGPMMYFFSKWLLKEAEEAKCEQMVFFARDCVLPYRMTRQILDDAGLNHIKLVYLPISRLAASGLEIRSSDDVYKIRVDDYEKSKPLTELLARRFHIEEQEIDTSDLERWTKKKLANVKVGDLPVYAVYRIARTSAEKNWTALSHRMDDKRRIFQRGLQQWGCDTNLKTMAVDFGYRGTIHRKITGLFSKPVLPRFFITFADPLGQEPIEGAKAYYLSKQVSKHKEADPVMHYNLLVETILNEGIGSALGYREVDGEIEILREGSVSDAHANLIEELHNGALQFTQYWERNCSIIDEHASIEPQMLSFLLREILRAPSYEEASMLSELTFDNGYSGLQARRIIQIDAKGRVQSGMWREGVAALRQGGQSSAGSSKHFRLRGAGSGRGVELRIKVFRQFISAFGTERMLIKYDRDPFVFFDDSSKPTVRALGKLVKA